MAPAWVVGFQEGAVHEALGDCKLRRVRNVTENVFWRAVFQHLGNCLEHTPPLSISQRLLLPMGSCCLITPTRSPSCMETSRSWAALKFLSAWKSFSGPYRTRSPARCSSVCTMTGCKTIRRRLKLRWCRSNKSLEKHSESSTHRSLRLLFSRLLLQSLPFEGLLGGRGWRQVLRAEAEALQKFKNSLVLVLELRDQVALGTNFIGKLETRKGRC